MMRADAAPMAPASWRSTKDTTAESAGAFRSRRRPVLLLECAKAAAALARRGTGRADPTDRRCWRARAMRRRRDGRELENIDELHRLASLEHRLRGKKRDPDQKADIGDHGPDRGMRDRIEAVQAEQRVGLEQCECRAAHARPSSADPARAREGGKQQRIEPDGKPAGERRRARRPWSRPSSKAQPQWPARIAGPRRTRRGRSSPAHRTRRSCSRRSSRAAARG